MDDVKAMIEAVKAHAAQNYNVGGWDYVVECYGDADIAEDIERLGATTSTEAIRLLGKELRVRNEIRAEHEAEADAGR